MGSIHKGHISLVNKSKNKKFFSIVTIYVNPTQFNEKVDFENYPRNPKKDINLLKINKCDAVYFPTEKEMYPKGLKTKKIISKFRNILCDKFRPGHFDGVLTIVKSLFNVIKPDHAFFGEKDFQQLKLIEELVSKFNLPIKIHNCKSIRSTNGISHSSRFKILNNNDKKTLDAAAILFHEFIENYKKNTKMNNISKLKKKLLKINIKKIDYIEIRDEKNLKEKMKATKKSRLFVAFNINKVRIIDNFILN